MKCAARALTLAWVTIGVPLTFAVLMQLGFAVWGGKWPEGLWLANIGVMIALAAVGALGSRTVVSNEWSGTVAVSYFCAMFVVMCFVGLLVNCLNDNCG